MMSMTARFPGTVSSLAEDGLENGIAGVGASPRHRTFLVVDGQALVRRGAALMLTTQFPGASALEAGSVEEALGQAMSAPGIDLVLLDLDSLSGSRVEAIAQLTSALGAVPVVVVSAVQDGDEVISAIRAGARAYVLKTGPTEVLERTLTLILSGENYVAMPRQALTAALAGVRGASGPAMGQVPASREAGLADRLTERQQDIFRLILAGCSNKEIARELGVLEGTVKVHVRAVMQKLGAKNRTQVAVAAARSGFGTMAFMAGTLTN